jgi:hypothetical protein
VNEFVNECRKEWKRLGVDDAVANEMATDLETDLAEAEAEGASAEEVLGSSAFDPRAFAAAWANERGVVPAPRPLEQPRPTIDRRPFWRAGVLVGLAVSGLIALIGAALVLHRSASAEAMSAPWHIQSPSAPSLPLQVHAGAFPIAFGLLLLLIGLFGVALTVFYWSPWTGPGRSPRRRDQRTPGGPSYS